MSMEYAYTVTLHGNKEKLKWAEGIINAATNNTSIEMLDFLSGYGILVPDNCSYIDCNA